MTTVCLATSFLLMFAITHTSAYKHNEEEIRNYRTMPADRPKVTPEIIRQPNATVVALKCSISHCNHHRKHVKWEIKHCSPEAKTIPCNQLEHPAFTSAGAIKNEWKRIPAKQIQTISCYNDEKISNLTVKIEDNVLYRCSVNNHTVKIFQIEVTEPESVDDGFPRILEMSPGDVTVPINSQLILQCKVYSSMQPLQIFWFKQCDGCADHVLYNSTHYTKINTSADTSTVQKEANVYVSKLNIYKVGFLDNGVYACVGVNGNSFNVKTAVVNVQGVENWDARTSFSLLFLIPLAFALIPVTVWLCYYRNRQRHIDRAIFQQRKKLIETNTT